MLDRCFHSGNMTKYSAFIYIGVGNRTNHLTFKIKDISMNKSDYLTHLIGTRVGDIDDTCSQLCLQVGNKGSLKSLSLVEDIVLISSTWQSQEKTEVTVPLQTRERSTLLPNLIIKSEWKTGGGHTVILRATLSSCEASSLILCTILSNVPPSCRGRER